FLAGCPAVQVTDPGYQSGPQEPQEDVNTATYHIVRAGETLYGIAGIYGRDYAEIARWNGLTPPFILVKGSRLRVDGPNENVVLPSDNDNAGIPVNSYPTIPSKPISNSPQTIHTVQAGETLYAIARKYGKRVSDLARWNNINPNSDTLSIGQKLIISQSSSAPVVITTPPATLPVIPKPSVPNINVNQGYHIVLKGDTLYSIAKHYGFSVADIAAWNGLQPPYGLRLNQQLRVTPPDATTILPTPTVVPNPKQLAPVSGKTHHIVAAGDTMYSIARQYGLKVKDLANWNSLVPPYILSIGQQLRIAPSTMPSTGSFQKVGLSNARQHIVAPGETLDSISKKYGVSAVDLAILNNFKIPYNVYPGMKLKITP
ncbi:MAG TPA: LysM peptidoglycan-binding domain-containing protein, partial [Thioploca sp.]|nr:LysM peptidoglycan-binding domain-containing protein [Thioploca sp.]